jgi:hypothetical protein
MRMNKMDIAMDMPTVGAVKSKNSSGFSKDSVRGSI